MNCNSCRRAGNCPAWRGEQKYRRRVNSKATGNPAALFLVSANGAICQYEISKLTRWRVATIPGKSPPPIKYEKSKIDGNKLYREIGRRIALCRKEIKDRQEDLASKLKVSRETIASIETGRHRISIPYLYNIADIFDRSILDFLPNIENIKDDK